MEVQAPSLAHPWRGQSGVDVKEAAKAAKAYVVDLFADEHIEHVGLEEVRFDDIAGAWEITIGFSRPWNRLGMTFLPDPANRSYKIVCINDEDGRVMSVSHRVLASTD